MADKGRKTVEVRGVEVEYDPSVLTSQKFIMAMGDISDEELDDSEKLVVNARIMRMLFGGKRYSLMDELESRDEEFGGWLTAFFEAVGAKN